MKQVQVFYSVFTIKNSSNIPQAQNVFPGEIKGSFDIFNIQSYEVPRNLEKLNLNKSSSLDDVSPRILKEVRQQITFPTSKIFTKSLEEKVANNLMLMNITPIYKKDRKCSSHYHPISLPSVLGKISDYQHGFQSKRS